MLDTEIAETRGLKNKKNAHAKNPSKMENVGLLAAYAADEAETYEALQKGPSRDAGGDGGNVNALWLADDADEEVQKYQD